MYRAAALLGGMSPPALKPLEPRLGHILRDLTEPMGRRERRPGAHVYGQRLLLDGDRQSIEPMACHLPKADAHALRLCVGQSAWEVDAGQRRLARQVVDPRSAPDMWSIDDTAFPQAGPHAVGVARQYCGTLGQVTHCRVAARWQWSGAEASGPLDWRVYLPKAWIADQPRATHVRVPPGTPYRSNTELAVELIDQALA